MSRKDYILIASILSDALSTCVAQRERNTCSASEALEFTAAQFAKRLPLDNPRFDTARFLKACGVTP